MEPVELSNDLLKEPTAIPSGLGELAESKTLTKSRTNEATLYRRHINVRAPSAVFPSVWAEQNEISAKVPVVVLDAVNVILTGLRQDTHVV